MSILHCNVLFFSLFTLTVFPRIYLLQLLTFECMHIAVRLLFLLYQSSLWLQCSSLMKLLTCPVGVHAVNGTSPDVRVVDVVVGEVVVDGHERRLRVDYRRNGFRRRETSLGVVQRYAANRLPAREHQVPCYLYKQTRRRIVIYCLRNRACYDVKT